MTATAGAIATDPHALTSGELADFHRQGYLLKRQLFPAATMAELARQTEDLHASEHRQATPGAWTSWEQDLPEGRAPRIRQLMNSEVVSPVLMAMSRSPELVTVMQQLLGPDLYLYHSKLMMKAAYDGTFTPWHQDFGYWQYEFRQPTQVNCMLAIDAANEENGAVRFVPGSHHRGLQAHDRFESDSFVFGFKGDINAFPAEIIDMEPGDGLFFGSLVIHGSAPNRSSRDRRANTFAFAAAFNKLEGVLPEQMHRAGRKG
jgi:ectoine hydroxylase-related dioxygenase (phytanoyl-CoA dioxygenase family)